MYNKGIVATKVWAVVDGDGCVLFSRGGSSSKSKLMVYSNEKTAAVAMNNYWTKQCHRNTPMKVVEIYSVDVK